MIDYSAVAGGRIKLNQAIYQYVLGINGRRSTGRTRSQIMKWFHGTPESFVVASLNEVSGDRILFDTTTRKFRVRTFGDVKREREMEALSAAPPPTPLFLNHWIGQAEDAILQGQTKAQFLAACHIENRIIAGIAYNQAKIAANRRGSL